MHYIVFARKNKRVAHIPYLIVDKPQLRMDETRLTNDAISWLPNSLTPSNWEGSHDWLVFKTNDKYYLNKIVWHLSAEINYFVSLNPRASGDFTPWSPTVALPLTPPGACGLQSP